MEQLVAHMVGDYILQNNWMANKKTEDSAEGYAACLIHVVLYCIPFLFLVSNFWQLAVIFLTHMVIDRFRLAVVWIKFWNWNWESKNYGFPDAMPPVMAAIIMFVIDNTFHITINFLALTFL